MSRRMIRRIAVACMTPVVAFAAEPDRLAQLEARLQAVEAELNTYKSAEREHGEAIRRMAQTRQEVLADAAARSELVKPSAGYSNGFFLSSPDSNFQLKFNGLLQPRYQFNSREHDADDESESGFEVRRAELYISGNTIKPGVFFQFAGGFSRDKASAYLVSAYAGYQFNKEWEIRGGAFKAPFLIEELTAAGKQTSVERSFFNQYFTAGTAEGVQVQYVRPVYRVAAMVHDGTNTQQTDFTLDNTDIAFAVRGEWLIGGQWSQFSDFQGWQDSTPALRLGAGLDYEIGEGGSTQPDILKYTVDLTYKNRGWSVLLAGVGKYIEDEDGAGDASQYGLLAQGGVFVIPNRMELFGRYEFIYLDGFYTTTSSPIDNQINLITAGVNWFYVGHNAKLTTDVIYVLDALPEGATGMGLLASPDGSQVVARVGMTVMF